MDPPPPRQARRSLLPPLPPRPTSFDGPPAAAASSPWGSSGHPLGTFEVEARTGGRAPQRAFPAGIEAAAAAAAATRKRPAAGTTAHERVRESRLQKIVDQTLAMEREIEDGRPIYDAIKDRRDHLGMMGSEAAVTPADVLNIGGLYEDSGELHRKMNDLGPPTQAELREQHEVIARLKANQLNWQQAQRDRGAAIEIPRLEPQRVLERDGTAYSMQALLAERDRVRERMRQQHAKAPMAIREDDDDESSEDDEDRYEYRNEYNDDDDEREMGLAVLAARPSRAGVAASHAHLIPPAPRELLAAFQTDTLLQRGVRFDTRSYVESMGTAAALELTTLPTYLAVEQYFHMTWRQRDPVPLAIILDELRAPERRLPVANFYLSVTHRNLLCVVRLDRRHHYAVALFLRYEGLLSGSTDAPVLFPLLHRSTPAAKELGTTDGAPPRRFSPWDQPLPSVRDTIDGLASSARGTPVAPDAVLDDEERETHLPRGAQVWRPEEASTWICRDPTYDEICIGLRPSEAQRRTIEYEWLDSIDQERRGYLAAGTPPRRALRFPVDRDLFTVSGCTFFTCACSLIAALEVQRGIRDPGVDADGEAIVRSGAEVGRRTTKTWAREEPIRL